jgi:hypothetical protein
MTSPLPLPDWVPWWVHLAVLLALLFVAIMFALMPFSVFGTKSRLEAIEIRLDEIQAEIRSLALRLPESSLMDEDAQPGFRPRYGRRLPPIPPAPLQPVRREPGRPSRTEPRL